MNVTYYSTTGVAVDQVAQNYLNTSNSQISEAIALQVDLARLASFNSATLIQTQQGHYTAPQTASNGANGFLYSFSTPGYTVVYHTVAAASSYGTIANQIAYTNISTGEVLTVYGTFVYGGVPYFSTINSGTISRVVDQYQLANTPSISVVDTFTSSSGLVYSPSNTTYSGVINDYLTVGTNVNTHIGAEYELTGGVSASINIVNPSLATVGSGSITSLSESVLNSSGTVTDSISANNFTWAISAPLATLQLNGASNSYYLTGSHSVTVGGNSGSNVFYIQSPNDVINGSNSATNTANFAAPSTNFTITNNGSSYLVTDNSSGNSNLGITTLNGVGILQFSDKTISLGPVVTATGTPLGEYAPNSWTLLTPTILSNVISTDKTVQSYKITDTGSTTGGAAHLQLYQAGVGVVATGTTITVTAAQLASGAVYYNTTNNGTGYDNISIAASDGQKWGTATNVQAWVLASDAVTVSSANALATIGVANDVFNPAAGTGHQLVNLTTAVDGTTRAVSTAYSNIAQISQMHIYDTGTDGGYFQYNNGSGMVQVRAATDVLLTNQAQIASLQYVGSTQLGASETLYINAYDGYTWSGWQSWSQVSGDPNDVAPVVTATGNRLGEYAPNGWTALTTNTLNNIISVSKAATMYQITDTGGHLQWYSGGVVAAGTTFTVTAAQIAAGSIYYNAVSGAPSGSDTVSIAAFDGQKWGTATNVQAWVLASDAVTVSSQNIVVSGSANYVFNPANSNSSAVNQLISISTGSSGSSQVVSVANSNIATISQMHIYDAGGDGGYFQYNNGSGYVTVVDGTDVLLTNQAQIASLQYVASSINGAAETLYVNAYDGYTWSGWQGWSQVSKSSTGGNLPPVVTAPTVAPNPFAIKAVSGVASWKITYTITPANGSAAHSFTNVLNQDTGSTVVNSTITNANITFSPTNLNTNPGDSVSITAQGYSGVGATGNVVQSTAQLSMAAGFGFGSSTATASSINFKSIGLDNAGNLTGLPASYSASDKTLYVLDASSGSSYSLASLTQALSTSMVLLQYAAAGQVGIDMLDGVVSPVGYNNMIEPAITINGVTMPLLPGTNTVPNWSGMAIKAPVTQTTTVQVWIAGQSSSYGSMTLTPGQTTAALNMGNIFKSWQAAPSGSSASMQQVYFTDSSGHIIPGLQIAVLPVTGGILNSGNWQTVGGNTITTYTGTVAQILAAKGTAPTNSLFYIVDSTGNIQSSINANALYNMAVSGALVGVTPTDGFSQAMLTGSNAYLTITNSSNQVAYVHADQNEPALSGSHQAAHSVLAIQSSGSVNVIIDGQLVASNLAVNGTIGYALPAGLAAGTHTIALTNANGGSGTPQIGVVPTSGGKPVTFVNSLNVWVGTVAQLPTGVNDIISGTLYVVSDSAANIVTLASGSSPESGAYVQLANTGYLAYSPTTHMTWAQFQQISEASNVPLTNTGPMMIVDSAYAIDNHFGNRVADQGVSFTIKDTMARLLSPNIASAALSLKTGADSSGINGALQQAIDNGNVIWTDSLSTILNSQNLAKMAQYYGVNSATGNDELASVQMHDTVADWTALTSPKQVTSLANFVNTNTQNGLTVDVRDTVANLYSALTGSGASAFESQLASVFRGVNKLGTRVEVQDSIANLEAAYNNGQLTAISSIANSLLLNAGAANNTGLYLRVTDTVANINSFLVNSSYNTLMSRVSSFTILDTASNIANGLTNGNNTWDEATTSANNIVVMDSYTNVLANASTLFSPQSTNSDVTKVIFTDVSGATANNPLVINLDNYSSNGGQLPQFDFSQAKGLQGIVTVSESQLAQSNVMSIGGNNGQSAIQLTVRDGNGHQVYIDLLTGNNNPDPLQLDLNNVILPSLPVVAPSPYQSPTAIPTISNEPFIIQGNQSVAKWVVTQNHYDKNGSALSSQALTVNQDSSGGNIAFSPNIGGPADKVNAGDYYSYTVVGLNGSGAQIATGQIGFNKPVPSFNNTFYLQFSSIDPNGIVVNAPFGYQSNILNILVDSAGWNSNYDYSLNAVTNALASNSTLAQYATNNQLGMIQLSGLVRPAGLNANMPMVSINGQSLFNIGSGIGPFDAMAIQWSTSSAATTVNVYQHITVNGQSQGTQNFTIGANAPINLDSGWWTVLQGLNTNANLLQTIVMSFTDINNNAIAGLQVASVPALGGLLSSNNWINVGSGSPLKIFAGKVSDILSQDLSSSNTVVFLVDSIGDIQNATGTNANALYNLIVGGKVIGASVTDGFDGIPNFTQSALPSLAVTNTLGQVAYVHETRSSLGYSASNEQAHSVLALNVNVSGSTSTTVSIYIDGQLAKSIAGISTSGWSGVVLPESFIANLSAGNHVITFNATNGASVQLGVLPPGGGLPSSLATYSTSLNLWVGGSAQLPTSINDIVSDTLYIINDTSANIIALDGYATVSNQVLTSLAATGYLAFNSTTGMGWAALNQLEQARSEVPITNISDLKIVDSAYVVENQINSVAAGQTIGIRDTMVRLLNSEFAQHAQADSAPTSSNTAGQTVYPILSQILDKAFDTNQINWVDSIAALNSTANESEMGAVYYGSTGQLASVEVRDTIVNFNAENSLALVNPGITTFTVNHASSNLILDVQDTAANIYALFTNASALSAFASQVINVFAGTAHLTSRVEINDSVANIEAYAPYLNPVVTGAAQLFGADPYASNMGLDFRVTDTVANIEAFIRNPAYIAESSAVSSYIVVDTAQNIINSIYNYGYSYAVELANNIVVKDSFANVISNAQNLFNAGNNNGIEATKIIFTDIVSASINNPLVIGTAYSSNGQMPQLDFSQAGFASGVVTVTESVMSSSQVNNLIGQYGSANDGVQLTITDSANHQVVVDLLANWTPNSTLNPDPMNSDILSVYLSANNSENRVFNIAAGSMLNSSNNTGPSSANYESIFNWSASDKISFANGLGTTNSILSFGISNSTSNATVTNGQVTFANSAESLDSQITHAEAVMHSGANNGAGHVAYWANGSDTYVLITGSNSNGTQDDLVKLVGVSPSQAHLIINTTGPNNGFLVHG